MQVLPTQILAAVRSRYFCFYDFTSRIADCSVCSGSTIATRIPNAVHRRLRTRGSSIESTLDAILVPSPSSSSSHESRWRTRKLRPLESSIGSIKRSILRARQIYEYTDSRRKSGDRTRYQSRTMTNFLFVGKYNVTQFLDEGRELSSIRAFRRKFGNGASSIWRIDAIGPYLPCHCIPDTRASSSRIGTHPPITANIVSLSREHA